MQESSPGNLLIRRYRDDDGAAVRNLFVVVNRALAPPSMRAVFDDYIERSLREEIDIIPTYYARRGGGFWVAELSSQLVGMFGIEMVDGRAAELRRMYVEPSRRRLGIARAMLEAAEQEAKRRGAKIMTLSTSELQAAAVSLYGSAGYALVREEIATSASNKTAGSGLRRFHFEKPLVV
jgi:GNAT superfamily N-acetyltransferase